jgi:excinuclease ABC subunit A
MLARYRGRTVCDTCEGGRLRKEATYVLINGNPLPKLAFMSIMELTEFFDQLKLSNQEEQLASRILLEIKTRLKTLNDVGLGYLTIERTASTLSGGETQRINLTRLLGSNLTASLYLLDEPSVGLHPRDTLRLISVLKSLRDLGNTVVVVEHEEEIVRSADEIIDIGPGAGIYGGNLVFAGSLADFKKHGKESITHQYLLGDRQTAVPKRRRAIAHKLRLTGARKHNLKKIDVTIPLQALTVVTGVSGSGKTSLVKHELHPLLMSLFDESYRGKGTTAILSGDKGMIAQIELVGQNPIGRSSRSNPVTYVKAYDGIRELFCKQQLAQIRGYRPKHFSFNVDGGRCETCKGDGEIIVEMQFLADVKLVCDECNGKRFKKEILEVAYHGKNINDILNLSIEEAMTFFQGESDIIRKIKPLADVGLGYLNLGQPSSTLSGGEAQRVKLASFLGRENEGQNIIFIFDEPTTGLHFHDVEKLLSALNALVEKGHTVVVVEHNLDVVKAADWVIDLGPEAGDAGGYLVFEGRPEELVKVESSYTGQFLKAKL